MNQNEPSGVSVLLFPDFSYVACRKRGAGRSTAKKNGTLSEIKARHQARENGMYR